MSDKTDIGDRMKAYENVNRTYLPRRTHTIVRVDGRAFHTLLKDAERPFDKDVINSMDAVANELFIQIQGAQFAYVQSDEVSVLMTDFDTIQTEPWFGGNIQKIASVSASIATMAFNCYEQYGATFDSRVFTVPDRTEVMNYFLWRQRDCIRNSIHMVARSLCSHKELQGLNTEQLQEKIYEKTGSSWADYEDRLKRGRVIKRLSIGSAPVFSATPGEWLDTQIPRLS